MTFRAAFVADTAAARLDLPAAQGSTLTFEHVPSKCCSPLPLLLRLTAPSNHGTFLCAARRREERGSAGGGVSGWRSAIPEESILMPAWAGGLFGQEQVAACAGV